MVYDELKTCPFCGKEAKLCVQGHREYPSTFYVKCTAFTCQAQTPHKISPTEAARIWNRRKDVQKSN